MKLLIVCVLLIIAGQTSAQCNVKKLERDDGVIVNYTRPDRIGYCDRFVLGLSMQTNSKDYYVVALCIFENNAEKLKGDFILFFNNNKNSRLHLYRSESTTIQGLPATMNILSVDENGLKNIMSSNIKMATAQLEDGVYQSIKIMANSDKLKTDYACLKTNSIN